MLTLESARHTGVATKRLRIATFVLLITLP